ncbi:21366_t:CDS:2, partial [Entrophospora sp. SA101]
AVSHAEIIEGYKAGADALQNTLVISGLTIDKDSILVAALNNDVDDELEKELENLLAAEEERKVVKEEVKQPIKEKNQELEKLETKLHDLK